ncbi:MAG: YitT family protein [Acidobacteriota bacterium]|nr:YitT family protein [Acidobacteriota bacterium]
MEGELLDKALGLGRYAYVRRVVTGCAVVVSAFLQAFTLIVFIQPAGLLSSGFTGLAIMIDRVTSLFGTPFPTFAGMIALNIPVAALCWRHISRRFVLFSMTQVLLAALFLRTLPSAHLTALVSLDSELLNVVFGGFLYGLAVALALKGGASTGGTDFISLMVSNRTGKTIWGQVFAGNCAMLLVFGAMFGWESAAWSIIFQFISTNTIGTLYHRYERVTLQVTTRRPLEVMGMYQARYRHGVSCVEAFGGYRHQKVWLLNTVVSAYEQDNIIRLMRAIDPHAVVNVLRTESFHGGFYRGHIDEPLPQELPRNEGFVSGGE